MQPEDGINSGPAIVSLGVEVLAERADELDMALCWYDFTCPFCYVGQSRTALLIERGMRVAELPYQAHPEIPPGGIAMPERKGPMYEMLELEARDAGLPLHWPQRLPNSRAALIAAEWVRRNQPAAFLSLSAQLFAAHFAKGEDLGDPEVIERYMETHAIDRSAFAAELSSGRAMAAVVDAEDLGRRYGVNGTPAWRIAARLLSGLRPAQDFEALLNSAISR